MCTLRVRWVEPQSARAQFSVCGQVTVRSKRNKRPRAAGGDDDGPDGDEEFLHPGGAGGGGGSDATLGGGSAAAAGGGGDRAVGIGTNLNEVIHWSNRVVRDLQVGAPRRVLVRAHPCGGWRARANPPPPPAQKLEWQVVGYEQSPAGGPPDESRPIRR